MKHATLRAIAHNITDSLASGIGLLIGQYEMDDVYAVAASMPDQTLTVDFLRGECHPSVAHRPMFEAVLHYQKVLPEFCEKHQVTVDDFAELKAIFSVDSLGEYVTIIVVDRNGKQSEDIYRGKPLKRVRKAKH